jgi:PAS domain S-box-containing protein
MESTSEIKRLQSCLNDLITVLALPAIWSGGESPHILDTLLDSLVTMLRLDFAYARLDPSDGPRIEAVKLADHRHSSTRPQPVGQALDRWLSGDQHGSRLVVPDPAGDGEVSIVSFSLGLQQQGDLLVAGSRRTDFPTEVERLLLRVAANQAGLGLREAQRAGDQKRISEMLEQRVAERTRRLTALNEELRHSEAYLAEAQRLTHTGSGAWRVPDGDALYLSDEWYRIYGFDPKEGLSAWRDRLQRIHPEDRAKVQEAKDRAISEKSDYEVEHRIVLPNGTVKYTHTVGHPVLNASGDVEQFVYTMMDISERKQAEEALRQAQLDLARISRVTTMGELTASLAHEVNQPIAAAITDANTCLRWLTRDSPDLEEARQAACRIVKDATRAGEIVSRIRMVFKKGTPEWTPVDVNEVIQEMIVLLRSETTRHSISARTELADLPQVMGDRVQLQQVLMNLILNSIDAMKDVVGPRELILRSQKSKDDQVLISVSDTGVGLPPQHADQIFDAFFTTKTHGTGMGLRISRSIVESHGGRLWAGANSPSGASFHLTLPATSEARE